MNVHPKTSLREDEVHESPLLKTVCRYPAESLQMDRKTETASTVLSQYSELSTSYKYDAKGHLVESDMRTCHEDYAYNGIGQRIFMLHTRKGVFNYTYDAQGKLTQVNDTRFQYDNLGRLSGTTAPNIPAKHFMYERVRIGELDIDRLATFQDSTGKSYTYSYTPNNPLPAAVHCYGQPVVTYQWDESGALPRLLGCTTPFATWQFGYLPENDGRLPDTVILTGPVVAKLGYWDLKSLQCKLGYDHLGTAKLIADPFNELVKELLYDSFGNIVSETEQRIYFPLGFAGGLRDIATGFVSFGYRDYDPTTGRFTTPDPALDMRGDGDIYDYCVDDPVNRMDAAGLEFTGSGNHEPVKMEPFRPQEQEGYWRTIPEPGACKKCLEMAQQKFSSRPERPHPNCKCEIEFVGKLVKLDVIGEPPEQEELTLLEALGGAAQNFGSSAMGFAQDLWNAVSQPITTLDGIGNILGGYACQLFGVESDMRLYSETATDYISSRYGTYEDFKKTLAVDPVGVAADFSLFLTAGSGAVRGFAKMGTTVGNSARISANTAQRLSQSAEIVGKIGTGLGSLGTAIDPLTIPGKTLVGMSNYLMPYLKIDPELVKILTAIARSKAIRFSKTGIGIGGTGNAINKNNSKQ